jgi:mannose-6-phosphate isomerase-like protein (cupin superfamily)
MAKQKATSRAAAKTAVRKKWAGLGTTAKSSSRKTIKSKGRGLPAAKPKAASKAASKAAPKAAPKAASKTKARPKQRIAISHHREEDFKADGLRTYAKYRDLGIADATHGLAQAHVIRLIGPCNPAEVSKLHYHDVEFQMVYVLKGWVKTYMEGQGETLMKEGSAWTQPPRIRHLIMDYSDDVELLEVILPAEFKTVELAT